MSSDLAEIMIASVTPYFLERDILWFEKNWLKIKKASRIIPWWKDNVLFLERDQKINLWELLRRLQNMGYEKVQAIGARGEFAHRGGIIDIAPVNSEKTFRLEFAGNYIKEIKNPESTPELIPELNKTARKLKKRAKDTSEEQLKNLKPNDYVVHLDHGIGIFQKTQTYADSTRTHAENLPAIYYVIKYAKGDTLYVPESAADKISPYIGFGIPIIHRLGGTLWRKTKRKIKETTLEIAKELLELYAKREIAHGFKYLPDDEMQRELESDFPYIETSDQEKAILEVKKDMESSKIMDRLICGDVGFGKTEVALRAAFKAVSSGKQVALLSPTTILCHQHARTFQERLNKFPVKVAMLSRLISKKEQHNVIKKINEGEIDIVIGTHRLMSRDIKFKNLGLIIIDEEQRFGVRQKEKFKSLRNSIYGVDILSLSATPIPRTLYFILSNLKDISLINTPPPGRLPIKTYIGQYDKKIIKKAIKAELKRRGQVYFLHDKVANINMVSRDIQNLIPESKIGVIHGRLPEWELIKVINDLKDKKINVLVATTIIENGIDFPMVNTLIVGNAAKLGLSQAYQIRGRIGRGHEQAYAYFLYRPKNLTEKGKKRLGAIKEAESLGSGYQIALRDLEIRGAGNILGREQSGHILQIGLNLYCQMLAETIEELKQKQDL